MGGDHTTKTETSVFGACLHTASSPLSRIWEAFLTGGCCYSSVGTWAGFWWVSAPPAFLGTHAEPHQAAPRVQKQPYETNKLIRAGASTEARACCLVLLHFTGGLRDFPSFSSFVLFWFFLAALEKPPASSQTCIRIWVNKAAGVSTAECQECCSPSQAAAAAVGSRRGKAAQVQPREAAGAPLEGCSAECWPTMKAGSQLRPSHCFGPLRSTPTAMEAYPKAVGAPSCSASGAVC